MMFPFPEPLPVDTNIVKIIGRSGKVEKLPLMSKEDLADRIWSVFLSLRRNEFFCGPTTGSQP